VLVHWVGMTAWQQLCFCVCVGAYKHALTNNCLHLDIRENVGHRANRLEFDAAVRRKHLVKKIDIAKIRLLVNDMAVIRNQDDAMSVDLLVQELRGEPYNPTLLYKRQHEVDEQYPINRSWKNHLKSCTKEHQLSIYQSLCILVHEVYLLPG